MLFKLLQTRVKDYNYIWHMVRLHFEVVFCSLCNSFLFCFPPTQSTQDIFLSLSSRKHRLKKPQSNASQKNSQAVNRAGLSNPKHYTSLK